MVQETTVTGPSPPAPSTPTQETTSSQQPTPTDTPTDAIGDNDDGDLTESIVDDDIRTTTT